MIVYASGYQVINRRNCVKITSKVQVDAVDRNYLAVTTTCGAAFDTQAGAKRWLTQGQAN